MLLHHARRPARFTAEGALVPLREQDRRRWDTAAIRTGIQVLQAALAQDRLGEFQAQAAIAALHADAPTVEETDWVQIVEWYDELVALTDSPIARLNRAVAVGEAEGPRAGRPARRRTRPNMIICGARPRASPPLRERNSSRRPFGLRPDHGPKRRRRSWQLASPRSV